MQRINRMLASSLALFLVAGTMTPAVANASSNKKTKTDASTVQGASIAVQVYNRGDASQDLKIDGQTYTVKPHQSITIKGASGAAVYADTAGAGYQKGELLFKFAPSINGGTVKIN